MTKAEGDPINTKALLHRLVTRGLQLNITENQRHMPGVPHRWQHCLLEGAVSSASDQALNGTIEDYRTEKSTEISSDHGRS